MFLQSGWLREKLYNLAKSTHGQLRPDKNYKLSLEQFGLLIASSVRDVLVPDYGR